MEMVGETSNSRFQNKIDWFSTIVFGFLLGNEDEYLAVDESTDDDGSIAYIDYEMGEDEAGEEDGFFVEYVNEIEDDTLANAADDGVQYEEEPPEGDGFTEYFGSDDLNEDDLYNCNLCGMDFKSITEHIEKFHSNEDVVIDVMEKSGAAIKTEKQTDPLAEDASVDENEFITAESDLAASQMIVYGDDHFDENNDFLDDLVDEDENDVYTYDESTGVLTKTQMKAAANKKENVNIILRKAQKDCCGSFYFVAGESKGAVQLYTVQWGVWNVESAFQPFIVGPWARNH